MVTAVVMCCVSRRAAVLTLCCIVCETIVAFRHHAELINDINSVVINCRPVIREQKLASV